MATLGRTINSYNGRSTKRNVSPMRQILDANPAFRHRCRQRARNGALPDDHFKGKYINGPFHCLELYHVSHRFCSNLYLLTFFLHRHQLVQRQNIPEWIQPRMEGWVFIIKTKLDSNIKSCRTKVVRKLKNTLSRQVLAAAKKLKGLIAASWTNKRKGPSNPTGSEHRLK